VTVLIANAPDTSPLYWLLFQDQRGLGIAKYLLRRAARKPMRPQRLAEYPKCS